MCFLWFKMQWAAKVDRLVTVLGLLTGQGSLATAATTEN